MLITRAIAPQRATRFISTHHYSKSNPHSVFTMGLLDGEEMVGAMAFRVGTALALHNKCPWTLWELSRLCLSRPIPNGASQFIGQALEILRARHAPLMLVSYADTEYGHVGYIYQATNWIYTGTGSTHNKIKVRKGGRILHQKAAYNRHGTMNVATLESLGYEVESSKVKHRYFYPVARSKKEFKEMRRWVRLSFDVEPYPKGEK